MQAIRFRLLDFPVVVQPAFLILLGIYLLFSLQRGEPIWAFGIFSAVVFGSILVHELGHATVARTLRVPVGTIHLHGLGGHVTHAATDARRQLAISLAGPGAGLGVGACVALVSPVLPASPVLDTAVRDLLFVNVGWSLFNLVPMMPLDGGQALRSALEMAVDARRALRWAATVGLVLGAGLALLGLRFDLMIILFLGGFAAYTNWQLLQRARA